MHRLRKLVLANRPLACAVLVLALMMKIVMPAGFMPTVSNGRIVVSICSGTGPMTMVITIPGLEHGKSGSDGHQGKAEQPCAFSGLSAPSLAAADPILLAAAILFVLALGTRPLVLRASTAPPYLRPPLRGLPAI
ncbi:hypothetical protein VHN57_17185 [Sphingobium sp. WW5]|uniref:hypothetical protein n=1 Tax=Sphingobium sp. WW5 TaxID=3111448 RepID=UPI0005609E99|nr:hypothetical protein A8G00_03115 [Sphingobium sp. SA916]